MENSLCLFCASECPFSFTIIDGQVTRLKSEQNDNDDHLSQEIPPFLEKESVPPLLSEHLKSIFILRTILGIEDEKLCKFLGRFEGQLHPEFWVQLCSSCGNAVQNYFKIFKEISTLQTKLASISSHLKGQIRESTNGDINEEAPKSTSIWAEVREDFLNRDLNSSGPQYFTSQEGTDTHFKCLRCPASYKTIHNIKNHVRLHSSGETAIPCKICGWALATSKSAYTTHFRAHHLDKPNTVAKSKPSSNASSSELSKNMTMAMADLFSKRIAEKVPEKPTEDDKPEVLITGDIPGDDEGEISSSGQYSTIKTGDKTEYKCLSGCSAKFDHLVNMRVHLRLHFSEPGARKTETDICKVCGAVVSKKHILRHLESLHPTSEVTVQRRNAAKNGATKERQQSTSVGNKVLEDNEQYSKVSGGSRSVKFYKCKKCPLMFPKEEQITAHLELHKEGSGAVSCEVCKWVLVPDKLQLHYENHHGQR